MFNYDIHNSSYGIEICNFAILMWRLYAIWSLCYDIMLSHLTILLLCWFVTIPWRSAIILCYFAIVFQYSSVSALGKAVLLSWFVIFIACVSLWCFVKVTCSSAWHSKTSFGQDKLFPAKIVIMSISFLSVALSWLETWRLFVKERWIYNY